MVFPCLSPWERGALVCLMDGERQLGCVRLALANNKDTDSDRPVELFHGARGQGTLRLRCVFGCPCAFPASSFCSFFVRFTHLILFFCSCAGLPPQSPSAAPGGVARAMFPNVV